MTLIPGAGFSVNGPVFGSHEFAGQTGSRCGALTGPETKRLEELWKKTGEKETEKDGK